MKSALLQFMVFSIGACRLYACVRWYYSLMEAGEGPKIKVEIDSTTIEENIEDDLINGTTLLITSRSVFLIMPVFLIVVLALVFWMVLVSVGVAVFIIVVEALVFSVFSFFIAWVVAIIFSTPTFWFF